MRFILAMLIVVLAFAAGCDKTAKQPPTTSEQPKVQQPAPTANFTMPPPAAPDAPKVAENDSDVLVEVNGAKLTRGQANLQIEKFLASNKGQIPEGFMETAKKQMLNSAIKQFVGKTLIEQEMDKQKIEVTKEDEAATYKEISASMPNGTTIEDIFKQHPEKADQLKEQIRNLIKADKLLGDRIKVSDDAISQFMEKNKERLAIPETVHARHILIAVDDKDDEKTKADKKKKAEDIRNQLLKGADFAELALKYSDCPSKQNGGDLGSFPREGAMVKEFSDAAFNQETNAIGNVVETKFGYHIIQVLGRNKAGTATREQVAFELKQEKRDEAVVALVKELEGKATIKYLVPPPADEPDMMPPDEQDAK